MPFSIGGKFILIKGLREAQNLIKDFSSNAPLNAVTALVTIGDQTVDQMQFTCPVDTGTLQSEIGVTEISDDSVTIESPTDYAGFVNFGTIHQEPQPYFTGPIENLDSSGTIEPIIDISIQTWNDLVDKYRVV